MNPDDFMQFFAYNHKVRAGYIEMLSKTLTWDDLIKNRETAWLSIRDTLLHIIWAENTWINYSIRGLQDPRRPFPFNEYQNWESIIEYNSRAVAKVDQYLSDLEEPELGRKVWRVNNDGVRRTIAVRDVLIHVFTEELHHRGEIIAMLWQMDIQPPDMGWPSNMGKTDPPWTIK